MSEFLRHTNCKKCGSSDALALYSNGTGYCWSCHTYFSKDKVKLKELITKDYQPKLPEESIEWIDKLYSLELTDRKLTKETCEHFKVKASVNEETGEIEKHYYPYYNEKGETIAYKIRNISNKSFKIKGNGRSLPFFGQNLVKKGGKLLIIVEGELDCLSAYQMLKERGKNYSIVSVPNGASINVFKQQYEWLCSFETIMLGLDQDDPGQELTQKVCDLLPVGKIKKLEWSEKDANELLKKGKSQEFFSSLFNSKEYRPDGIVTIEEIEEEAIKPIERGLSYPWKSLTEATFGIRFGEIVGLGGAQGGGKTEFCKELVNHITQIHNLPIGIFFLEENVTLTAKVLAGKIKNKRFHIPDGDWTIDELKDGINKLKGKVYLYNHEGMKDWKTIQNRIRYLNKIFGVRIFLIDHLTAMVSEEMDEFKSLNRMMKEMATLAQNLDISIFFISHLATPNGTPHEEGGRVMASQFRGSRAIAFWSNFLFGLERNQQATDEKLRNTTTFRILKDRYTGLSTGNTFKLVYDHTTGKWDEPPESYVDNDDEDFEL